MLKLSDFAKLGRPLRQDDEAELGEPTTKMICNAIDEGRLEDAKALAQYSVVERKPLHDLFADFIWDILTQIAQRFGENEVGAVLRASQSTWMMKRAWKSFLKMTVRERVQMTAEMMRSHVFSLSGSGKEVEVIEEPDRWTIKLDPCGVGGRMRRGDPADRTPSRLGPPYNFGTTKEAHNWSWGKKDVPYYCVHCAFNEILPMEWGGHPLWVTGYDPNETKPCAWHFYKSANLIPEEYYARVGRKKPVTGGQY
jgi:hypothetical protein